ncbi:PREDICTED: myosin heavy chain, muscle-like [Atta cephalotes]|uniref:Uncharacterized protein n=1 Tax=Atta cephalotes TaxID=12957 RepID=A0A158NFA5_ATTCE|nr:PREDICTED: myosin heavy chain, muscle-like [Atta cephalotes]
MLAHHCAESMTVSRTDKQAPERHTFNKKSMQEGNEESTSNENGEIELNKQADEGYKQRYPEKELFEGGRLKKIIKRADVEKAKRKVEGDLKFTQKAVVYLERNKKEIDPSNTIQRKDNELSFSYDELKNEMINNLVNKLQKQIKELQKRIEELEEEVEAERLNEKEE